MTPQSPCGNDKLAYPCICAVGVNKIDFHSKMLYLMCVIFIVECLVLEYGYGLIIVFKLHF